MNKSPRPPDNNRQFLMRYAGLASQLLVAIGLGVFLGLKADAWLRTSPLFSALLPLLILVTLFYKLFKETSRPDHDES